jgi:hypothetical protein
MNERIQELSEQAGINVIPRRPYFDEEPDGYLEGDNDFVLNNHEVVVKLLEGDALKKFAELIVGECLMKAIGAKIRGESIDTLIQNIKEDFGVEE